MYISKCNSHATSVPTQTSVHLLVFSPRSSTLNKNAFVKQGVSALEDRMVLIMKELLLLAFFFLLCWLLLLAQARRGAVSTALQCLGPAVMAQRLCGWFPSQGGKTFLPRAQLQCGACRRPTGRGVPCWDAQHSVWAVPRVVYGESQRSQHQLCWWHLCSIVGHQMTAEQWAPAAGAFTQHKQLMKGEAVACI